MANLYVDIDDPDLAEAHETAIQKRPADPACSLRITDDALLVGGKVRAISPAVTRWLRRLAGCVFAAGAVWYFWHAWFVVGAPLGEVSLPGVPSWALGWVGTAINGLGGSAIVAAATYVVFRLLAVIVPGNQPLVYQLGTDGGQIRSEVLVGGGSGDVARLEELPMRQIASVRTATTYLGRGPVVEIVSKGGATMRFGRYLHRQLRQTGADGDLGERAEAEIAWLAAEIAAFARYAGK